jgi:predicted AlkP superfamily phosphohydrolase/phosphomutase
VNLIGREPAGKVRPGAEYREFMEALERDLLDITNLNTGNRIVKRVIRTSDLYSGDSTEHFPDLLVEWAGTEPVESVLSDKIGRLDKPYRYCRTGRHIPSGLFIASGPGIPPGRLNRQTSILDFAPTFCAAFGITCDGLDGRAIPEIAEPLKSRHSTER